MHIIEMCRKLTRISSNELVGFELMDDSLKDLLKAETEAEAIVSTGELERDAIIQKSLDDAHAME